MDNGYSGYCLFVILCVCTVEDFFPPWIKLAASNFARWFIGAWAWNLTFWKLCSPKTSPEAQNRTNWPARGPRAGPRAGQLARVAHALADSSSALATRRIGMWRCTAVPEDGRICVFISLPFTTLEVNQHLFASKTWLLPNNNAYALL